MLAPVGREYRKDMHKPIKKHRTDIKADEIITFLKLLKTLMEVRAGNIIRLEISTAPIILIPTTMVKAVSMDMSIL